MALNTAITLALDCWFGWNYPELSNRFPCSKRGHGGTYFSEYNSKITSSSIRCEMGTNFVFMGDSSPPHRATIVDECLEEEDTSVWIGQFSPSI
ncbi:hypothetical protein AVEN_223457-1 [Araneus ventricosus]|uniref:Uncharacterized protein n=1 Tax=Araneus ventricosus TaxID=182803 RepID=A0A4Y2EQZ6_ARAVE|nr:hypothetical protein AVEN_223457-1 [Araneus ventricosus]